MRGKSVLVLCSALIAAEPAAAAFRRVNIISPQIDREAVATVGTPVFQRENAVQDSALIILGDVPEAGLKSGDQLLILQNNAKKVTGCGEDRSIGGGCVTDKNPVDGLFETYGNGLGTKTGQIANPVRYTMGWGKERADYYGTSRQQLTFLGVADKTLRLSYREFSNDMARPAFTDEVTFTLSGKFPETIAYRDVVIDILEIGNAGMRYVVRDASPIPLPPPPSR